jgi:enoyl-CoA hydratase
MVSEALVIIARGTVNGVGSAAMADAPLLVSREGAIALLTINRPDKRNALNREVLEHLYRAFTELRGSDVRVAILTGAGDKAFVAGADIAAMKAMTTAEAKAFADLGHRTGDLMESVPFPIIAAVNGFALGGGCELAMACDLIYASDKAQFGQPEVNLAVIPGFGGTQRLPRRVGFGKARELVLTGDMIDANEAHRIGLCEAVVPHAELQAHVRKVAEKIASKGPLAIAQAKVVLRRGDPTLPSANELEAQAFAMLFGTSDQKEGMTAFLEKRPPTFTSS